jgi:hypothetical protein
MTLHGAGASSCRDFAEILDAFRPFLDGTAHDVVAQRTTANYLQYEEWLEGYIFGIETNIRGVTSLVSRWCPKREIPRRISSEAPPVAL